MPWLRTVRQRDATGELARVYGVLAERGMPAVYEPAHGDVAGIILAHSLDPDLMSAVFSMSASLQAGTLSWEHKELVSAATSRANECMY